MTTKKPLHEIIVGNIGSVYRGGNGSLAGRTFCAYVDQSKGDSGRAAGEDVTWMKDGEIHQEHRGSLAITEERALGN